jgi:hypothetical protein
MLENQIYARHHHRESGHRFGLHFQIDRSKDLENVDTPYGQMTKGKQKDTHTKKSIQEIDQKERKLHWSSL